MKFILVAKIVFCGNLPNIFEENKLHTSRFISNFAYMKI